MRKYVVIPMLLLCIVGTAIANTTMTVDDYTPILILVIISQILIIALYFYGFKLLSKAWKIVGGLMGTVSLITIIGSVIRIIEIQTGQLIIP